MEEKIKDITDATGKVVDNRKKAIIGGAALLLLIVIIFVTAIAPKLKTSQMIDVVDYRGDKAAERILQTGIAEDKIIFKEYEDNKGLDDSKNYSGDLQECFVIETNPAGGETFHTNTETIDVGVKSVDTMATEMVGAQPNQLFDLADKYGFVFEILNTYKYDITDSVKTKPENWTVKEFIKYEPSANIITFSVTGSKEYEDKIKKEEEDRLKAEEKKKAEEEAAKDKAEKDKKTLKELKGKPLGKALDATKDMEYEFRYCMVTYNAANQQISMLGKTPEDGDYDYGDKEDFFSDKNGYTKDVLEEELWVTEVRFLDDNKVMIRYAEYESALKASIIENY